ncbi:UBX domain-containing protein 6-like isoform X2 [Aethina tumida]|uniref:UBX domain-containing protein 6-like isoform X2 n=1 Tax=Aethina tumida TaxID=116153 RepID=UPI002147C4C1|nr:UBX domain-containing protein 6-like isoform X2 [Aethina tumida]
MSKSNINKQSDSISNNGDARRNNVNKGTYYKYRTKLYGSDEITSENRLFTSNNNSQYRNKRPESVFPNFKSSERSYSASYTSRSAASGYSTSDNSQSSKCDKKVYKLNLGQRDDRTYTSIYSARTTYSELPENQISKTVCDSGDNFYSKQKSKSHTARNTPMPRPTLLSAKREEQQAKKKLEALASSKNTKPPPGRLRNSKTERSLLASNAETQKLNVPKTTRTPRNTPVDTNKKLIKKESRTKSESTAKNEPTTTNFHLVKNASTSKIPVRSTASRTKRNSVEKSCEMKEVIQPEGDTGHKPLQTMLNRLHALNNKSKADAQARQKMVKNENEKVLQKPVSKSGPRDYKTQQPSTSVYNKTGNKLQKEAQNGSNKINSRAPRPLPKPERSGLRPSKNNKKKPAPRTDPSEATRQAAQAALARVSQVKDSAFNTSLAAIQAQVRRELENEKGSVIQENFIPQRKPEETELEASPHLAVKGVYFRCPFVSEEVLSRDEWKVKIQEFLYQQLEDEKGLTSCLIIHSCNYNRMKVEECVATLCRYLDNIIAKPEEDKYHKIRCQNATYLDKVQPILGTDEFLESTGFRKTLLDHNGSKEFFWLWSLDNVESIEVLKSLRETLTSGDRVELEIDRNIQVLSPVQATSRIELPQDFFAISPEELKKEQQLRKENAEKQLQLRTKAMREKDELREIRKYKFALIRIRFPDGLYLQGTFSVYEKFSEVLEFVRENLDMDAPFELSTATGQKFGNEEAESSLVDLRLVPATILIFKWDKSIEEDIALSGNNTFLKPEIMILMQST